MMMMMKKKKKNKMIMKAQDVCGRNDSTYLPTYLPYLPTYLIFFHLLGQNRHSLILGGEIHIQTDSRYFTVTALADAAADAPGRSFL